MRMGGGTSRPPDGGTLLHDGERGKREVGGDGMAGF
jgi:hypothetical protein